MTLVATVAAVAAAGLLPGLVSGLGPGRALGAVLQHDAALNATPQAIEGATYAAKITREEAALSFHLDATQLARKLRAFDPYPGCSGRMTGTVIKLWAGESLAPTVSRSMPEEAHPPRASEGQAAPDTTPGTILEASDAGVVIACGHGALRVTQLQKQADTCRVQREARETAKADMLRQRHERRRPVSGRSRSFRGEGRRGLFQHQRRSLRSFFNRLLNFQS